MVGKARPWKPWLEFALWLLKTLCRKSAFTIVAQAQMIVRDYYMSRTTYNCFSNWINYTHLLCWLGDFNVQLLIPRTRDRIPALPCSSSCLRIAMHSLWLCPGKEGPWRWTDGRSSCGLVPFVVPNWPTLVSGVTPDIRKWLCTFHFHHGAWPRLQTEPLWQLQQYPLVMWE